MVGRFTGPGAVAAVMALAAATSAHRARAEQIACPPVWPPPSPGEALSPADPDTLLGLRDIGHPDPGIGGASPLAVSPDGRLLAFFVTQPVMAVNDRCETLVVVDMTRGAPPRALDSGGTTVRIEEVLRGVRRPSGVTDVNVPLWSADGRTLVYRKRTRGHTKAWRAGLDGSPPTAVGRLTRDVEALAWSEDRARLLVSVRPRRAQADAERRAEARSGFLYDARVLPHLGPAPQAPADMPETILALSLDGDVAVAASAADAAAFAAPTPLGAFALGPAESPLGARAGAEPVDAGYFTRHRLWVEQAGRRSVCSAEACAGWLRGVWWQEGRVMALKREGWGRESSAIVAWTPRSEAVRTVVRTAEWLTGCVGTARAIVCLAESARRPRRIVAFDPQTGRERTVFEPNPEVSPTSLPPVVRLRWRNNLGLAAWGDLVLPPGVPPSGRWPLVIVQYTSEGFLRGGTGDEYPVFPLAARGIAVLSFQRPELVASLRPEVTDVPTLVAALYRGWADRRSVHDSLMRGIDLALQRGDIDPHRIGITGLSDGATTARFALINDNRFAAAAISTCCLEPHATLTYGGIAQGDWFRSLGYPNASTSDPDFWRPMSLALNADHISTPLLMQLADDEYLQALETFDALRDHDQPVEMIVFPDEHHNKWQPVHRRAIYTRNLDWFAFWLQDRVDSDPAKADQYRRWSAMKSARQGLVAPD